MSGLKDKAHAWLEGLPAVPKLIFGIFIYRFQHFLAIIALLLFGIWILTAWHLSCGDFEIHPGIKVEVLKGGL